jgi:hypothetical protein
MARCKKNNVLALHMTAFLEYDLHTTSCAACKRWRWPWPFCICGHEMALFDLSAPLFFKFQLFLN